MKRYKNLLFKNRLMEAVSSFSGFQKLLYFFVPIFVFIPCYVIKDFLSHTTVRYLTHIMNMFILWFPLVMWCYLILSLQVHLQQRTQNLLANIFTFLFTAAILVLSFF